MVIRRTLQQLRGDAAERRAEKLLRRNGLHLLARNYGCRYGEIDLVMRDAGTVVFVEVRHRQHAALVHGAESIDVRKQERLRRAAEHYLARSGASSEQACRFDVICSTGDDLLEWIPDAF